MSVLRRMRRAVSNKVVQPDYAGLTNVVFHGRWEGLVNNTTNAYGTVSSGGAVTAFNSVSPHATGVNFASVGTAPTLDSEGILFANNGALRHSTASTFDAFSYNATPSDMKWTIHGVIMVSTISSNPGALFGIFGNNGASTANKGISFYYDDRVAFALNNALNLAITNGTGYVTLSQNTNVVTPQRIFDFWIECDKSKIQEEQISVYINGFKYVMSNRIDSTTVVTTPTYGMDIGSVGNGANYARMKLKEITFQTGLMSSEFRSQFITARMYKYNITPFPTVVDDIQIRSDWNLFDTLDEGTRYYLTNHLCQKPSDPNTIVSVYDDADGHVILTTRRVAGRISYDKGRTWSAPFAVMPAVGGVDFCVDPSAGYGPDDRLHMATCTQTTGGVNKLYYSYSDDDGATWSTPVNLSSLFPSDTMTVWRTYGKIIENSGRLMFPIYRVNGTSSTSERACVYSDDNGATWNKVVIASQTTTATYRNETDFLALSSTFILAVSRDENTKEYYISTSSDNGSTWTNHSNRDFGENFGRATPVRLRMCQISGVNVVCCYYSDRDRDLFKCIYAKASDLIADPLAGWSNDRKVTLHQGSNDNHLHYGDVCHYDGNFMAIGQYVIDPYPGSGSGTENKIYTFDVPTFQYSVIKSLLGI
jgi:hypothetical protein